MSSLVRPSKVKGIAPWLKIVRERPANEIVGEGGTTRPQIASPDDAYTLLSCLEREEVEVFVVLLLDAQRRVMGREIVTRGVIDSTLVHSREVFRLAIAYGAASIIIAHNHPSGTVTPSAEDRTVTNMLASAGRLLDIPVDDHIIVGAGTFTSFKREGLL